MHISDDRYFRDRERHDLALRMIRHEARTCTIRECTGLTDDRIRRLYKTYAGHMKSAPARKRGKSPRQVSFFTRNAQGQFEASLLASMFISFGLLGAVRRETRDPIEAGRLFCDAYELHGQLLGAMRMSFEHAWFLLQLLCRGRELELSRCRQCDSLFVRNDFNPMRRSCPTCKLKALKSPLGELARRARRRQRMDHEPSDQVSARAAAAC